MNTTTNSKLSEEPHIGWVTEFAGSTLPESELTIEDIRERADKTSEVLENILHKSVPARGRGINE